MKRIEITKTTSANGGVTYTYSADMSNAKNIRYHPDMIYAIAEIEDESLVDATDGDLFNIVSSDLKSNKREELKVERDAIVNLPINNIQVAKPQDQLNIQGYILWENEEPIEWTMADNTTSLLFIDDLRAALNAYAIRKRVAYEDFNAACRELELAITEEQINNIHVEVVL